MRMKVWVVTIDTIKNWDEFGVSYLPTMHQVFGVYQSEKEAKDAVWSYFGPKLDNGYEIGFDREDKEGNYLYYDDLFILTDPNYNGQAYYCINYHLENLNYEENEETVSGTDGDNV